MSDLEQALEHHRSGRLDKAESIYRSLLKVDSKNPDAFNFLGMLLTGKGEAGEAVALLKVAVDSRPDNLSFQVNYAAALEANGQDEEALAWYAKAVESGPEHYEPTARLGLFLAQRGFFEAAEPHLKRSVELRPDDAALWVNLGNTIRKLGRLDDAAGAFERAIELAPENAIAWNCLGEAFQAKGLSDRAIEAFKKASELDPGNAGVLANQGLALHAKGRLAEAISILEKARELGPESAPILASLASAYRDVCMPEDAVALFRTALGLESAEASLVSKYLYTLNFVPDLPRGDVEQAHSMIAQVYEAGTKPKLDAKAGQGRKLRLGFLSGDFCAHSVAYFLLPLLEEIDRDRFEIHCFSEVANPDSITAKFESLSDGWLVTCGRSASEVANRIKECGIDLLIDLSGHTAGHRLDVVALAPAPVIVNWLGYPNRIGLAAIDGRIVDHITDPDEVDGGDLYRMDAPFLCYRSPYTLPEVSRTPALKRGYVTFGSFNNAAKINDRTLTAWSEILKRVPGSRLLLKSWQFEDTWMRERFVSALEAEGIESERLEFVPRIASYSEHMEAYGRMDIALDTFPYNGTTTTCEALWMGVPVVAWTGDRHASRVGASLLTSAGLGEFVASHVDGYIDLAAGLASDVGRLDTVRSGLREQVEASPLGDTVGFARRFESMLFNVWEKAFEKIAEAKSLLEQGLLAQRSGKLIDAVEQYRKVLEIDPSCREALHYIGVAEYGLGNYVQAVNWLSFAAEAFPNDPKVLTHYGSALQMVGRCEEAVAAHEKALVEDPASATILSNYGNALLDCGRVDEAIRVYRRCLDAHPENAQAWSNYAAALKQAGHLMDAVEANRKACEADPRFSGSLSNLGTCLVAVGLVDEAIASFKTALEANPRNSWAWSNLIFAQQYSDTSTLGEIAEACRSFGALFSEPDRPALRADRETLRIGFVSADLREHAVARFLIPLLEGREAGAAEIFLYSDSVAADAMAEKLQGLCEQWRSIYGSGDDAVASLISKDEIDVLIDLGGHSARNRLGLFAKRPAPLQATWLGFPGSTGLKAIDLRIIDRVALSEEECSLFPEKPLWLDDGFHCIQIADAPEVASPPSGPFTFGSFNNLAKASPRLISAWAAILKGSPDSRLLLKSYQLRDPAFRDAFSGRVEKAGVAMDRVVLKEPDAKYRDHLGAYGEVDLCLDAFPYNGTTTTCEALWMGVPTLTVLGHRACERVGASLLTQVGLDEFICDSEIEYVKEAIRWAGRGSELAALRTKLRGTVEGSSLGNGKRFAAEFFRKLDAAYREACEVPSL